MQWVVPMGLVVGIVLGALGGGGAILLVPVLVATLHLPATQATATSLVVVGVSSLVGAAIQARSGSVRVVDGLVFGLLGILGAAVGSRLSVAVPEQVLLTAFVGLLLVVAVIMAHRLRGPRDQMQMVSPRPWWVRIVVATGVGLLTGLFGVGGGFVVVPALTLVLGFPMNLAVGTSLVVIAVNSLTSLAFRLAVGLHVPWSLALTLAGCAIIGGLLGTRAAQWAGPRRMSVAFVVLLVLVATVMAAQNLPALLIA